MIDKEAYQWRHQMENCVARIKAYRGGATRYDKTTAAMPRTGTWWATLLASR